LEVLLKRRQLAGALLCTAAGGATAFYVHAPAVAAGTADAPARRLSVQACKFDFAPKEIRVTKGERVTIVLTSPDFVHGFSVPDFNVRADGIPGKTIEVTFIGLTINENTPISYRKVGMICCTQVSLMQASIRIQRVRHNTRNC